ncbi:MAG: MerR family transcriptional regulator [Leptolyngbyaceae cyanobacterium]
MTKEQDIGISGFTRQEALRLTQCTSSRLVYLEKVGLINPTRIGSGRKPLVLFSWDQIVEIKAIRSLRKDISLQTIRKIIDFLNQAGYDKGLKQKRLVVVNDDVFWVKSDLADLGECIEALIVASKKEGRVGQYVLLVIPPLVDIVNEIWETAKQSNVIDFESFKVRAKAQSA